MKSWIVTSFYILLVSLSASGQQASDSPPEGVTEIESLRRALQEQRAEIESLRQELRAEADRRSRQEERLESLIRRLDTLAAAIPAVTDTVTADARVKSGPTDAKTGPASPAQDKTANTVESGFGKVKFTGLLQGGFVAGDQGFNDTFRIRRAEMRFTGEISPKVKWSIMIDPAKALSLRTSSVSIDGSPVLQSASVNQSSRIFQEGFITLSHSKLANISVGQFKIPLSQEGLQSSSALDTIERALFLSDRSRGGGLGDARDLGIMAFGTINKQLDYQVGLFNGVGESQNDADQNDQKAVVGRLVFSPSSIKGLQIGASGAFGTAPRRPNPRRDRLGAEIMFARGKFRAKGELMTAIDNDIHRRGYYAHFGYRFHPKLESIFRYDVFDPDTRRETAAANAAEKDYIGGLNYYIRDNNLKLQFNYIRKTFSNRIAPSRNVFLINLQTAW